MEQGPSQELFNRPKQTRGWQRYKNALLAYSNAIKKAKRKSFKDFYEGIPQTTKALRPFKIIAKGSAISSVCLKKADGALTENEDDRIYLPPKIQSPGSYSTAEGDKILLDTPTMTRTTKGRTGN